MPINDYLKGIENYTSGQQADVKTAAGNLAELQTGAGSLPNKLKEALNTKLNNNKDIINQQSDVMQQYFAAPSAARAKYQNVWNPFEREKLVAQERTMALKPYDTLTGVLDQRMGNVADITEAGVQGWQGMVNAAATQLEAAQTRLGSALQAYQIAGGQQEAADNLALAIANAKEASRQFGIAQDLENKKFNEGVRQFDKQFALDQFKASGGGSGGKSADKTLEAWNNAVGSAMDDNGFVNEQGVWNYINQNQDMLAKTGVNVQDLWNAHSRMVGNRSSAAPAASSGGGFMSGLFGDSDYGGSQMNLSTGKVAAPAVPKNRTLQPGDPGYVNFSGISGYLRGY